MASTRGKKTTGSKAGKTGGKRAAAGTKKRTAKKTAARPVRREVGAFVCLFLAVFTVLACFDIDALFIRLLRNLLKGMLGGGFYAMPVAFFDVVLDGVMQLMAPPRSR